MHGLQKASYHNFVYSGKGCPACAEYGYNPEKPGSFYIVKWAKDDHSFIKFGITNRNILERISEQNRHTLYDYEIVFNALWKDGKIAKVLEKKIKDLKLFEMNVIKHEEFPDGFTETINIENLDKILKIVENYNKYISC